MLSNNDIINEKNNSFEKINTNTNITSRRQNLLDNMIITNSNIKLDFEKDANNNSNSLPSKEEQDEEQSSQNKSNDKEKEDDNNSLTFDKEDDENSMDNIEEDKNEKEKEKKLDFLYHKYINSYRKKKYDDIIKDISNKKNLFNKKSPMSFNIFLLKLKCLLKGLKNEFIELIQLKNLKNNYLEISKMIHKILKEFKAISSIIDSDNKRNYEQITQIYCKFMLYLSLISKLKEEYIKSFEYLILGINSLRIYFIKQGTALDIKTYSIYSKILLLVINQLIGDNNYSKALQYCNLNFKVLEVVFKFMKTKNIKQKHHLKFLDYIGYNYLYIGLCLEQNDDMNYKKCFEAYRQANYFLKKEENVNDKNIFKHVLVINAENENINLFLSEILIEKYKKKFEEEKLKKELALKQYIKQKFHLNSDKNKKVKININDLHKDIKKYIPIEKSIYKNILTSNAQNNIEKLDNELISVIYKQSKNNNGSKRPLSNSIKKNLCNLKVYNILMSDRFREYVIKNKNFEFNNPIKEKQSIENLQRYLNNKIEICVRAESPPPLKDISNSQSKNSNINLNKINLVDDKNIFKNKLHKNNRNNHKKVKILAKNVSSLVNKNENNKNNMTYSNSLLFISTLSKKNDTNNNNHVNKNANKKNTYKSKLLFNTKKSKINNSQLNVISQALKDTFSQRKNQDINTIKKINKYTKVNSNKNITESKSPKIPFNLRKLRIKSPFLKNTDSLLQNDFERQYLDKNLLSKKYFKKFFYLDSLTSKELSFQKRMLDLKDNNSKLYFGDHKKELKNDGKMSREEAYKKYLELNNKAINEIKKVQIDDYPNEKCDANLFDNNKSVLKVLNKYILASKEKKIKKIKVYSESYKNIKLNNENKILSLNDGIKELNLVISFKNKKLQNHNNIKNYD